MRRRSKAASVVATAAAGALGAALCLPGTAAADPAADGTWYLDAMHIREAQQISTGEGVTIAVIDTGVNADLPELSGRVLRGWDSVGGGGRHDQDGHGTAMAALAAGDGDGVHSTLGVAPDAKILPYQVGAETNAQRAFGSLSTDQLVRAVHWVIDHGARVVNLSIGGPDGTPPSAPWKRKLVRYAGEHDAVLVAASGNKSSGTGKIGRPGDIAGVLTVAGTSPGGTAWDGAVTGKAVVVSGPAQQVDIPVLAQDSELDRGRWSHAPRDGTSGATALVSGELALIMSKYPRISSADAINRVIKTVTDRGDEGRDPVFGYGTVNALAALTTHVPHVSHNPLLAGDGSDAGGQAADAEQSDDGGGLSTGWLVTGVAAVLVLIIIVIVVIVLLRSRHRGNGPGGGGGGGGSGPSGGPPPTPTGPGGYLPPGHPSGPPLHTTPPPEQPVPAGGPPAGGAPPSFGCLPPRAAPPAPVLGPPPDGR